MLYCEACAKSESIEDVEVDNVSLSSNSLKRSARAVPAVFTTPPKIRSVRCLGSGGPHKKDGLKRVSKS